VKISEMMVVETTYQCMSGGYLYRVTVAAEHTIIKRTPHRTGEIPLWNHGVITEVYDIEAGKFVPSIHAKNILLSEADAVIAGLS
jgi:hypothetical protein